MRQYTDALGITLSLDSALKRIISLVPSQTELLHYLGLEQEVVGITKFCVHPGAWHRNKPRVGGTKQLHIEKIKGLQPDLVIANKEENTREQIEAIRNFCPVYTTAVGSFQDALQMIDGIGGIMQKEREARILIASITSSFDQQQIRTPGLRAAYLIWKDPYMTVGGDTFIHDMMLRCGLMNVFENEKRYPVTDMGDLQERNCDVVLLSSEPYPFKTTDREDLIRQLPDSTAVLVDGEMFSWYGNRMLEAASYFSQLQEILHTPKP